MSIKVLKTYKFCTNNNIHYVDVQDFFFKFKHMVVVLKKMLSMKRTQWLTIWVLPQHSTTQISGTYCLLLLTKIVSKFQFLQIFSLFLYLSEMNTRKREEILSTLKKNKKYEIQNFHVNMKSII